MRGSEKSWGSDSFSPGFQYRWEAAIIQPYGVLKMFVQGQSGARLLGEWIREGKVFIHFRVPWLPTLLSMRLSSVLINVK